MLGCFVPEHHCIDNAIHTAAGVQLREECHTIIQQQGHPEETGTAKITKGYNLPAKFVLHTVGPIVRGEPTNIQIQQLSECYRSCLDLAVAHDIRSIAFCCISTGIFAFPKELAANIAIDTVGHYLGKERSIEQVIFNVFMDDDFTIYHKLLSKAYK
jgi:O-acetyl-ADP-ribose deacetylase (regulator of RNase III)